MTEQKPTAEATRVATELVLTWQKRPLRGDARDNLIAQIADLITAKDAEIERLMADSLCPGVWLCDKCGFTQFKSILHAQNGAISSDTRPHLEPCPNDGRDMRPVSWRERTEDVSKVCEGQIKRAVDAEEERDKMREQNQQQRALLVSLAEALKPFSQIAKFGWKGLADDGVVWWVSDKFTLKAGDFRKAAALLSTPAVVELLKEGT